MIIMHIKYLLILSIIATGLLGSSACVDIEGPQMQPVSESDILSRLTVGVEAIMMMKGDTLPLTLTATAMDGSIIEIDPTNIVWKSVDPGQVSVDTLGRLIGRMATVLPVHITASYTHNIVTMIDTVSVYVTQDRIEASSIKIVVLDSNRIGANAILGLPRVRIDLYEDGDLTQRGSQIPIQVPAQIKAQFLGAGGPNGEPVYEINNNLSYIGKFWVKSSVNLFGVKVLDSVEFEGLYPAALSRFGLSTNFLTGEVIPLSRGFNEKLYIQPCAFVVVLNAMFGRGPIDWVFSDSLANDDGCATVDNAILQEALSTPIGQSRIGGNVNGISSLMLGVRRSSTVGIVSVYVHDSESGERLPYELRYTVVGNR